jgi:H+/Cl- antiporter ClcA
MIYTMFLLIATFTTVLVIYKMFVNLNIKINFVSREHGNYSSRLHVSSLVGMFSTWFLCWLYLVSTSISHARHELFEGNNSVFNSVQVAIMGIVAGILVGLLSRKRTQ